MNLPADLQALAQRLGHRFERPQLLVQAVVHRSFSAQHNERLEFLGDSVLNLAVSALLYERLTDMPEGDLSRVRANLVKQEALADIAQRLSLAHVLRLGEGERKSGGHKRPSILADALEAVIGAVFLDAGYTAAEQLVRRLYANVPLNAQMTQRAKDAKTELQEWLQGRKRTLPSYRVVATLGEAHQQTFDVECVVLPSAATRGLGASRRAAEQAAAAAMLEHLCATAKPPQD